MSFQEAIKSSDGVNIQRELHLGAERFVLFTRLSESGDEWVIGVTDGFLVWTVEQNEDSVKEWNRGGRLKDISHAIRSGDAGLKRSHDAEKLVLSLQVVFGGSGPAKPLDWTLQQPPDTQLRTEMKGLLFSLWENLRDTTTKLQACEADLSKARNAAASGGGVGDLGVSVGASSKTAAAKQKRIKGASIVNPSSKRRKAATGVVFDADN